MKDQRHETSHTPVRDYDRDRYGYDHPASSPRRHGHSRFADRERDSWQGPSPTYDPKKPDGRPSRTLHAASQRDSFDGRDGWQRLHDEADAMLAEAAREASSQGDAPTVGVQSGVRAITDELSADDRLREAIRALLAHDDYDWAEVEVHVACGEATLTGTVPTREMKYEAERVADSVHGVRDVINQIRVRYEARG